MACKAPMSRCREHALINACFRNLLVPVDQRQAIDRMLSGDSVGPLGGLGSFLTLAAK